MSQNSGGDSLARGLTRFTFQPAGSNVTQERWEEIWKDYKPKKSKKDKTERRAKS